MNSSPKELEVSDPLHLHPLDRESGEGARGFPKVNDQFLGLRDVKNQVVPITPTHQLVHFPAVVRFILVCDEANN